MDPPDWLDASPSEVAALEAAHLQHDFVRTVRIQQERIGETTEGIAQIIGMHPDQLRRIYRGESRLMMENMVRIARAVGLGVSISLEEVSTSGQRVQPAAAPKRR